MKITDERKQEALRLLKKVDEKQWKLLLNAAEALTTEPTPEEKAAEAERQEQHRLQLQQKKEALIADSEAALRAWKERHLKGVKIPDRYEITSCVFLDIYHYATRINPDGEAIFNIIDCLYMYGFKRGMAYSKAQEKKKAALHAANTKNGLEHSTDEI